MKQTDVGADRVAPISRPRILRLAMLVTISLAAVLPCSTAHAVGWGAHVEKGSDIIMNDLRWPVWDKGTYYCFWYLNFYPKSSSDDITYISAKPNKGSVFWDETMYSEFVATRDYSDEKSSNES